MSRFTRLLNLYIIVVGALAGLWLLSVISIGLGRGSVFNTRYVMLCIASVGVLAVMVLVTILLLVDDWDSSLMLARVVPAHIVGGSVALGFAFHVTPTTGMAAPALNWLVAVMFYLLAAAACISITLQLYLASPVSNKRPPKDSGKILKAL